MKIIQHRDRRRIFSKKDETYRKVYFFLFKTIKKAIFLEMLLVLIILAVCIITDSYFLISCCVYNVVNGLVRFIILFKPAVNKENGRVSVSNQNTYTRCIAGNILLLIASLYLLGASRLMFFIKANTFDIRIGIFLLVLPAINLSLAFYYFIKLKIYTGIFIKSYRFMIYANAFVTTVLFIGAISTVLPYQALCLPMLYIVREWEQQSFAPSVLRKRISRSRHKVIFR